MKAYLPEKIRKVNVHSYEAAYQLCLFPLLSDVTLHELFLPISAYVVPILTVHIIYFNLCL